MYLFIYLFIYLFKVLGKVVYHWPSPVLTSVCTMQAESEAVEYTAQLCKSVLRFDLVYHSGQPAVSRRCFVSHHAL